MGDAWSAPSPDAPDSALAGLPAEASGLALRRVASLHCLSLRHLPGGDGAARQALAEVGLPGWPAPGDIAGTGPWLVWRSPGESVVIATDRAAVDGILSRLQPGAQALACAVDLSDGRVALEVQGAPARIEAFLSRLIDPRAWPRRPLTGTWTRLVDIPVGVFRLADDRVWLLADRRHDRYLAAWAARALDATGRDAAAPAGR